MEPQDYEEWLSDTERPPVHLLPRPLRYTHQVPAKKVVGTSAVEMGRCLKFRE
jgi:hypothetical protein